MMSIRHDNWNYLAEAKQGFSFALAHDFVIDRANQEKASGDAPRDTG